MKKLVSLLIILMPIVANAAVNLYPDYHRCPDGYTTAVTENFMKYMYNSCRPPYNCLSYAAESCLVNVPGNVCWLYLAPNQTYTESDGSVFSISNVTDVCPESGETGIADYGATRCVNLPKTARCTEVESAGRYGTDSILSCGDNVEVRTVGICSSTTASAVGTKEIMLDYDVNGKYCWCRTLSPFVSEWVYTSRNYSSASSCRQGCGEACRTYMIDTSSTYQRFRQYMLTMFM